MDIKDIIKNRRKELGLTLIDIAEACDTTKATISRWESGDIKNMKIDKVVSLSRALKLPVNIIVGCNEYETTITNVHPISIQSITVEGRVSRGNVTMENNENEKEVYIRDEDLDKCDFCLICDDDSMINSRIRKDDIVLVSRTHNINNGDMVVINMDNTAILKRYYYYDNKNMIILKSDSNDFDDLIFTEDEFESVAIIGKVIGFYSVGL